MMTGTKRESDSLNDDRETCVSTTDPMDFYTGREPQLQGDFKALNDRGIRITSYTETYGAGRPLKRNGNR